MEEKKIQRKKNTIIIKIITLQVNERERNEKLGRKRTAEKQGAQGRDGIQDRNIEDSREKEKRWDESIKKTKKSDGG